MKRIISLLILLVFTLLACSLSSDITPEVIETPTPTELPYLTDERFAANAVAICDELEAELNNIVNSTTLFVEIYEMEAEAYHRTADKFAEFHLNEESAPQAITLRMNMMKLAEATESFANALDVAVLRVGLQGLFTVITTGDGTVLAFEGDNFFTSSRIVKLDIDETIVLNMINSRDAVNNAAEALGLNSCRTDFSSLEGKTLSPTLEATSTPQGPIEYIVQEGDSCASIAAKFGVSVQSIINVNNLSSSCDLFVGLELLIIP